MSKDKPDVDHRHVEDHPAGVTVQFSRVSGSRSFFGSSIKSHSWIQLTIRKATLESSFGEDRASTTHNPIVEVDLSPAQFAELLTTMNYGVGVFGTMTHFDKKSVEKYVAPEPEIERTEAYVHEKIDAMFARHEETIAELSALVEKSKLNQKDKKEMLMRLRVDDHLRSNYDFFKKQLTEVKGKLVTQAKAEVEAHISASVSNAGLEALRASAPQMQLTSKDKA